MVCQGSVLAHLQHYFTAELYYCGIKMSNNFKNVVQ